MQGGGRQAHRIYIPGDVTGHCFQIIAVIMQTVVRITQQRFSSLRGLQQCCQSSDVHESGHSGFL